MATLLTGRIQDSITKRTRRSIPSKTKSNLQHGSSVLPTPLADIPCIGRGREISSATGGGRSPRLAPINQIPTREMQISEPEIKSNSRVFETQPDLRNQLTGKLWSVLVLESRFHRSEIGAGFVLPFNYQ